LKKGSRLCKNAIIFFSRGAFPAYSITNTVKVKKMRMRKGTLHSILKFLNKNGKYFLHIMMQLYCVFCAIIGTSVDSIPGKCSVHFIGWWKIGILAGVGIPIWFIVTFIRHYRKGLKQEKTVLFIFCVLSLFIMWIAVYFIHNYNNKYGIRRIFTPITLKLAFISPRDILLGKLGRGSIWICKEGDREIQFSDFKVLSRRDGIYLLYQGKQIPLETCTCSFVSSLKR